MSGARSVDRTAAPRQTDLVLEDGVGQLGAHDADAPAGVALELDDLVGGVDDLVVQLAPVLRVALRVFAGRRAHVPQSRAGDVDAAPDRHARVAVLADDVPTPRQSCCQDLTKTI